MIAYKVEDYEEPPLGTGLYAAGDDGLSDEEYIKKLAHDMTVQGFSAAEIAAELDDVVLYGAAEKHLQGRHDQMTHAHGGGGGEPELPPPPRTGNVGIDAFRQQTYDDLGIYARQVSDRTPYRTVDPKTMEVYSQAPNRFGNLEEVPGTRGPLKHVYREVSDEEYASIKRTGRIQSDERMNVMAGEGTVTSIEPTGFYLPDTPEGKKGHILKIAVNRADGWEANAMDSYIKTNKPIPASRIVAESRISPENTAKYRRRVSTKAIEEKYAGQPRDRRGRFAGGSTHPAGKLVAAIRREGGYTYQPVSGYQPKTGKMVSDPGHEVMIKGRPKARDIQKYLDDNADALKDHSAFAGAWFNRENGTTYLDVSRRYRTDRAARRAAIKYRQEAYYDLATGETTYVRAHEKSLGEAIRAYALRAFQAGDVAGGDPEDHRPDMGAGGGRDDVSEFTVEKYAPGQPHDRMGRFSSSGGISGGGVMSMESGVVSRIAEGKPSRVHRERVAGVLNAAADGPPANLENLKVNGEPNLFDRHLTNRSRADMPQVPPEKMDGYRKFLASKGVKMRKESVDPRTLTASQNELDAAKVGKIYKAVQSGGLKGEDGRLLVSREGGVIDGHHRWAAIAAQAIKSPGTKVKILRLNVDIETALSLSLEFTRREGIAPRVFGQKEWMHMFKEEKGFLEVDEEPTSPPPDDGHPWMWVGGEWVRIMVDNDFEDAFDLEGAEEE